jgi:hypothetical protein
MDQPADEISTAEVLRLKEYAADNREHATQIRDEDPEASFRWLMQAEQQEGQAAARLHVDRAPAVGPGGEFAYGGQPRTPAHLVSQQKPNAITIEASEERLHLIERAGAHSLALDLVQDSKPRDSRERLLAHGEATLHAHAMKLIAKANEQTDPLEIARLTNAACKCFSTAQEAALVIAKLRGGGSQKFEVRHVHLHSGGQAIVGNVKAGSRKRKVGG